MIGSGRYDKTDQTGLTDNEHWSNSLFFASHARISYERYSFIKCVWFPETRAIDNIQHSHFFLILNLITPTHILYYVQNKTQKSPKTLDWHHFSKQTINNTAEEKSNGSDTAKSSSSSIAMDGKNGSGGSVGGNSTSFKNNPTSKKDDGTSAGNETNELADGDNVVQANEDDNNAGGNGGGNTKGDERLVLFTTQIRSTQHFYPCEVASAIFIELSTYSQLCGMWMNLDWLNGKRTRSKERMYARITAIGGV